MIRWSVQEIRRVAMRLAQQRIQPAFVIAWSAWQRAHQPAAQKAHIKPKRNCNDRDGDETIPNYADIARVYGIEGVRVRSAAEFRPALEAAIASGKPTVIDVAMVNNPTPTSGHWNILDIYSPDTRVSHVATE